MLDPRDNTVVAMTSHPSFDPIAFVTGLPAAEGARMLSDPRRPFMNRALAATYPPGSTFKVITAAAGLERGGYTAASRFPCPPVWFGLGPAAPKNNWNKVDEGALTIAEGLMRSCNPVFYDIALRLDGIDANILPSFAAGFGLGRSTGINGLDDAAGIDPNPDWKKKQVGEAWFSGDSVNMGIGQGFSPPRRSRWRTCTAPSPRAARCGRRCWCASCARRARTASCSGSRRRNWAACR
ncbi:MAG: penicillin-binding transpeptidase domain-containing protein [Dehalococcoidia bacterium]